MQARSQGSPEIRTVECGDQLLGAVDAVVEKGNDPPGGSDMLVAADRDPRRLAIAVERFGEHSQLFWMNDAGEVHDALLPCRVGESVIGSSKRPLPVACWRRRSPVSAPRHLAVSILT
jgi:hypothetical protein